MSILFHLLQNITHVIMYLVLNTQLCPARKLFYVSNGDPSWDVGSLINSIRLDFQVTHYVCATQKNLPIQEETSMFVSYKEGGTREVKPQSRDERGLQRRYVEGDDFNKLNRTAISFELEAEAVKQDFLKKKILASRKHYHTKKGEFHNRVTIFSKGPVLLKEGIQIALAHLRRSKGFFFLLCSS